LKGDRIDGYFANLKGRENIQSDILVLYKPHIISWFLLLTIKLVRGLVTMIREQMILNNPVVISWPTIKYVAPNNLFFLHQVVPNNEKCLYC